MKTQVYYFSGTGNSLVVARDIAKELQAEVISVQSVIKREVVKTEAVVIGLVFPVYMWGCPLIIERFVRKIENIKGKYIFAIATYGGMPGGTINMLGKIIKDCGGTLSAGFGVCMPGNYTPMYGAISEEKQKNMFNNWSKRVGEIAEYIKSSKSGKLENGNAIVGFIFTKLMRNALANRIPTMDKDFWVDEKCNGCTICEKVCPVNNIVLKEGKPVWNGSCEQCFACLQWCPKEAIQSGKKTSERKRYHNPKVKVTDLIQANKNGA